MDITWYNYTHLYTTHVRPDICCINMMNIHPAFVRDIIMIYLSTCHATAKIHNTELTISLFMDMYGPPFCRTRIGTIQSVDFVEAGISLKNNISEILLLTCSDLGEAKFRNYKLVWRLIWHVKTLRFLSFPFEICHVFGLKSSISKSIEFPFKIYCIQNIAKNGISKLSPDNKIKTVLK